MVLAEDPFVQFLRSLSGQTVIYRQSGGDLDGAIASLAFYDLCRNLKIDCAGAGSAAEQDGQVLILGPGVDLGHAVGGIGGKDWPRLLCRNRVVVAPRSLSRYEDIEPLLGYDVTLFCRDASSLDLARLAGLPVSRVDRGLDMAVHLDMASIADEATPDGANASLARAADMQGVDDLDLCFGRAGADWNSRNACVVVVGATAELIRSASSITTDRIGVAILAAKLDKKVRLLRDERGANEALFEASIAPFFQTVSLTEADEGWRGGPSRSATASLRGDEASASRVTGRDTTSDVSSLTAQLRAARREVETLRQENDLAFAARLARRIGTDERRAAAKIAAEAGTSSPPAARGSRLVSVADVEQTRAALEARLAEAEDLHRTQILRVTQAAADLKRQLDDAMARQRDAEFALQRSAEMAPLLEARLAALDRALTIKAQQVLDLQTRLDDEAVLLRMAETKSEQMRALIDRHVAAGEASERLAQDARRLLVAITGSRSWRALGPLRAAAKALGRSGPSPGELR